MSGSNGPNGPRLVIAAGSRSGERYPLRLGDQVIGRADTADVVLGAGDVSREHAHVWWDGSMATVTDAGSSHGTQVNGYRIIGTHVLRPGDVLRLGSAELRFDASDGGQATGPLRLDPPRAESAGVIGNSVGRDNYGEIVQAGRDLRYEVDYHTRLELNDPMDELFKGRGVGRLLVVIGLLIAFAGFAGWAYLIFSGLTEPDANEIPDFFEVELFGVPAAMVAFGSVAVGGIIASIGKGMSKASRERAERVLEMRRRYGMTYR